MGLLSPGTSAAYPAVDGASTGGVSSRYAYLYGTGASAMAGVPWGCADWYALISYGLSVSETGDVAMGACA